MFLNPSPFALDRQAVRRDAERALLGHGHDDGDGSVLNLQAGVVHARLGPLDSGSLIVDRATHRPAALLFAGSPAFTAGNHVSAVLAELAVSVVCSDVDLEAVKKRLSPRLLDITGVSGVGVSRGQLTIYLENDSDAARQQVDQLLAGEAPDTPTRFVVAKTFEAR